jgi:hypothetical protein
MNGGVAEEGTFKISCCICLVYNVARVHATAFGSFVWQSRFDYAYAASSLLQQVAQVSGV